jgi:hypothetical protein
MPNGYSRDDQYMSQFKQIGTNNRVLSFGFRVFELLNLKVLRFDQALLLCLLRFVVLKSVHNSKL